MPVAIHTGDLFSYYVPVDLTDLPDADPSVDGDALAKARRETGAEAPKVARIGGIMSSEGVDFQNEVLIQDGIDWGYFLKHGWFNWEHQPGPENLLGYPERVLPTKDSAGNRATRVEGVLLLDKPKAREVYETAAALRKAGGARQIGYSIEGNALMRDPRDRRRVLKSRVLNTTITAHPMQPDSRLEVLARSLMGGQGPACKCCGGAGCVCCTGPGCKCAGMHKGADVGYQTPASGGGSLGALVPQGLGNLSAAEAFARREAYKRTISATDLAGLLCKQFPALSPEQARTLALTMCKIAPAQRD